MKILIIGGGNMGMTYAQSFLRSHITSKDDMMILEKSPEKADVLAKKDIGTIYGHPKDCLPFADLVIFAVKPQDSPVLFENIRINFSYLRHMLQKMRSRKICSFAGKRKCSLRGFQGGRLEF